MNKRILCFIGSAGLVLAGACSDDDVTPNPGLTAGTTSSMAGAPSGGEAPDPVPTAGTAGKGSSGSSNGGASNVGGSPTDPGAAGAGGDEAVGGNGGAGPVEPPYDCVLHPVTHLEIINACTDAARIEKHPNLPPVE